MKLFMTIVGCSPPGRLTEQHDVFFGIAESVGGLVPQLDRFWPECNGKYHLDAWREVRQVGPYRIDVREWPDAPAVRDVSLFFVNLGGYKPGEFEEFHYKMLHAGADLGEAVRASKETAFYRHTQFPGATSHVDDKYGVDVDDAMEVEEILAPELRERYRLVLTLQEGPADELHIGYFKREKLV